MKKHNGKISFVKFAFAVLVVALHLGFSHLDVPYRFAGGGIAVDFFFIVSGYLFCKKTLSLKKVKKIGKETFKFFTNKIKRFLPYILFLWIIGIPICILLLNYTFEDFERSFFNIIFIPLHNNPVYDIQGICWYISALVVVQTILFPLLLKYKENFVYLVSPIIVLFLGSYLLIKFGDFSGPWQLDIFCYKGITRAFVSINLGMILYLLKTKLDKIEITSFSKVCLTFVEIMGYLSIFVIVNKPYAHARFDILMIIILFVCVLISFSEKAYFNNFSNNKFFYFLEKLSLPIYLNQWVIIKLMDYLVLKFNLPLNYYSELLVIVIILCVIAILEFMIIDFCKKHFYKFKKIFIKDC